MVVARGIVDSIVGNIEVGMELVWHKSLVGGRIVALCRIVGCKMGLVVDMVLLGVMEVLPLVQSAFQVSELEVVQMEVS